MSVRATAIDNREDCVVGDRSSIEGPLRATLIAPIVITDIEGSPVQ